MRHRTVGTPMPRSSPTCSRERLLAGRCLKPSKLASPLQAFDMAAWNVSEDLTGLIHHSDRSSNLASLGHTDRTVELDGTHSAVYKGDG